MSVIRCPWVNLDNGLYVKYHDEEWGVPLRSNDNAIFERITLEGAQAGLSWLTILRKRENYRIAFDGFDPVKVAKFDEVKVAALLTNPGIVRNRLKINSTINNARIFLEVKELYGSFDKYLWNFVDGRPIQNSWKTLAEIPTETEISRKLSRDLLKRGFRFVGPTICYAMMQAVGMVNDHTVDCFRHSELLI